MSEPLFTASISMPPSANALFKNLHKGRAKTSAYQTWLDDVFYQLRAVKMIMPKFQIITYPIDILIEAERRHVTADIDNRIKPVLDALQHGNVIQNDRQVEAVLARWKPKGSITGVIVSIVPARAIASSDFQIMGIKRYESTRDTLSRLIALYRLQVGDEEALTALNTEIDRIDFVHSCGVVS